MNIIKFSCIPTPPYRFKAFTLAEVLITLVIIGVIAAITVPTLIAKYHHEQTITRLKKAFSEISQAIRLCETEYGTINSWDFGEYPSGIERSRFFAENFLFKHMNIMKKCIPSSTECYNDNSAGHVSAISASGYSFVTWIDLRNIGGWINVDINGPNKGPNVIGKDIFEFKLVYKDSGLDSSDDAVKLGVWMSGLQYKTPLTRDELIEKKYCGALIQYDGWQFKPDNPCY